MERSHACTGSSTPRGPLTARDSAARGVAFRRFRARRHPGQARFRGSIAGLRAPLSTLRCALAGRQRMTQGHRDSLDLRCGTLSFPSLMLVVRRFPESRARRLLRLGDQQRARSSTWLPRWTSTSSDAALLLTGEAEDVNADRVRGPAFVIYWCGALRGGRTIRGPVSRSRGTIPFAISPTRDLVIASATFRYFGAAGARHSFATRAITGGVDLRGDCISLRAIVAVGYVLAMPMATFRRSGLSSNAGLADECFRPNSAVLLCRTAPAARRSHSA
jgi:hypothetical protein